MDAPLLQLLCFVRVVEAGSFAGAAGATHEILCRFGTGFVGYPARSLSM